MSIVPVCDARVDALSRDWPEGHYRCNMTTVRSGYAITAHHILEGADELNELVVSGAARFAVEVVSSATFRSSLVLAPEGAAQHTLDLDAATFAKDGAQARPGLIAVRDCALPVTHLSPAWRELGPSVEVQAGQWLARGQHAELTSPQMSLLTFVPDPTLLPREMRCRYAHPTYEIAMHPDDLVECQENEGQPAAKTVMLAAWVSALADANHRSAFGGSVDGEEDASSEQKELIGYQLEAKIKAIDPECPAPGDEGYDPLRAATVLLGQDLIKFAIGSDAA
ncbi:hypothetical protein [Candidatus Poriferisodalis sp.]|uniref:hypothetical protein n=1 Tax=Candidatus Poriferisodalis sp. TaxID=3101277 RepID=UPI003B5BADDB